MEWPRRNLGITSRNVPIGVGTRIRFKVGAGEKSMIQSSPRVLRQALCRREAP